MASIFNKEDKEIVLGNAELQRNFEEEETNENVWSRNVERYIWKYEKGGI